MLRRLGQQPAREPSKRSTSVDTCVDRIRESIVRGESPAGSALPPERVLATQLGVNRTTLRAAIQRLTEAGLLEAQQGRGTFVRDFQATAGVDVLGAVAHRFRNDAAMIAGSLDPASLGKDLLLVRRCLARAVLESLVEVPPGPEAIEAVRLALVDLEVAVATRATTATLASADMGVVGAIVAATGRPALRLCMNPVVRTLTELPSLQAAIYADPAENVRAFSAFLLFLAAPRAELVEPIVQSMAERDADTLSRLMRLGHLDRRVQGDS